MNDSEFFTYTLHIETIIGSIHLKEGHSECSEVHTESVRYHTIRRIRQNLFVHLQDQALLHFNISNRTDYKLQPTSPHTTTQFLTYTNALCVTTNEPQLNRSAN